jgi:nucleoside-diphosphate-sugar epimerase
MNKDDLIISLDDHILVTGANGFIGSKIVETLISYGFSNLRCFVRPSSNLTSLNKIISSFGNNRFEVVKGNLLSRDDCNKATEGVAVILHLAAGIDKSFPGAYMNSVVTTRNLLDSAIQNKNLKRFLNVSSFAVYSNINMERNSFLDETCEVDNHPELRYEAYTYGKFIQDELVLEYNRKYGTPYVIVRPSVVFGPGKKSIPSRVGIGTFGIFLHLGGSIQVPLTYIDNCAEAIVLAGIKKGVNGEVFNIVDDNLPTSKEFLRMYKRNVGHFKSIYIPVFYFFSYLWEKYSKWSKGQLPPLFNLRRCAIYWKGNRYSNEKLKNLLGWTPRVTFEDALKNYFKYQKEAGE